MPITASQKETKGKPEGCDHNAIETGGPREGRGGAVSAIRIAWVTGNRGYTSAALIKPASWDSVGNGGKTGVVWAHNAHSIAITLAGDSSPSTICIVPAALQMLSHVRGCTTEESSDTPTNSTYHTSTRRAKR